jgi:hypothetical protein
MVGVELSIWADQQEDLGQEVTLLRAYLEALEQFGVQAENPAYGFGDSGMPDSGNGAGDGDNYLGYRNTISGGSAGRQAHDEGGGCGGGEEYLYGFGDAGNGGYEGGGSSAGGGGGGNYWDDWY